MNKYFIFSFLLFVSLLANAQNKWTLDDCIQQAIKENLELKQSTFDNKIKKEDLRQSRMALLPTLNGYLSANNSYGRSIDPSNNEIVSTQLLQTGISASSSLTLFQGFVNINRVQYNRLTVLKGSLNEEILRNDIIFKVMNAFFDFCFSKGQLQIALDQFEMSTMNLNKIRVMVDAGIKAGTDVAEIESRLAQDDFKVTQARNNVYKSKLALQQLLNNTTDITFDINNEIIDGIYELEKMPDPDSVFNLAEQHLPQFGEIIVDSKISTTNLAIARGGRMPVLRAQAGYGTGYYDSYKDQNGSLIGFHDQLGNNGYQYVGLSLSIPLFNGWQVNRSINNARWNVEKTNAGNEIKIRNFRFEIENACLALKSAADEYRSSIVQKKASDINLQLAEKKWEQGIGNLLELTDARNRKASAEAEMLRTQLQYQLKFKTIQIFTGEVNFNQF